MTNQNFHHKKSERFQNTRSSKTWDAVVSNNQVRTVKSTYFLQIQVFRKEQFLEASGHAYAEHNYTKFFLPSWLNQ